MKNDIFQYIQFILELYNDDQVPNTYSHYSDIAMETLLVFIKEEIENKIKIKLDAYLFLCRIYKKGDIF